MEELIKKPYYSVSEVRKLIFNNGLSLPSVRQMLAAEGVIERIGRRQFIPYWYISKKLDAAYGIEGGLKQNDKQNERP